MSEKGGKLAVDYGAVERLVALLNGSGIFWVEAQETDGVDTQRLTVSDRHTGQWISVCLEFGNGETD